MKRSFEGYTFALWDYYEGHQSLLIRSPKGGNQDHNIDLIFRGVEYVAVPSVLKDLILDEPTKSDRKFIEGILGELPQHDHVYVLVADSYRHFVVAVALKITEHNEGIYETPFEKPPPGYSI